MIRCHLKLDSIENLRWNLFIIVHFFTCYRHNVSRTVKVTNPPLFANFIYIKIVRTFFELPFWPTFSSFLFIMSVFSSFTFVSKRIQRILTLSFLFPAKAYLRRLALSRSDCYKYQDSDSVQVLNFSSSATTAQLSIANYTCKHNKVTDK